MMILIIWLHQLENNLQGVNKLPKLYLVQIGEERSIVMKWHTESNEWYPLIINNDFLMQLDELGLVV